MLCYFTINARGFVALTHEGDQTLSKRVELLRVHRDHVIERIAEMQKYLDKVTWKLNFFSEKLRNYEQQQEQETPNP